MATGAGASARPKSYQAAPGRYREMRIPETLSGSGVHAFQTAGEFRLEARGDATRTVKYGYVLLRLRKQ